MEEIELTLEQAMLLFEKKRSTLYNWMNDESRNELKLAYRQLSRGRIILTNRIQIEKIFRFEGIRKQIPTEFSSLHSMESNESLLDFTEEQTNPSEYNETSNFQQNTTNTFQYNPSQYNPEQAMHRVMDFTENMTTQMKEYIDRVINAEKQCRLLEDSENKKTMEYNEIIAKCKQLEEENKQLKEELSKTLEYRLGLKKIK